MWVVILIVGLCGCSVAGERVWSVGEAVRVGAVVMGKVLEGVKVDGMGGGEEGLNVVSLMMKLMGVEPKKMEKFALEGFISLVQLMSRILIPDGTNGRQDRSSPNFSLFHFIVTQSQVADLLTQMQEPNIMDHLLLQNNHPSEDTDCIRLLLCKTHPFVRGMQKAVRFFLRRENVSVEGGEGQEEESGGAAWEKAGVEERMYFFMPSLEEVVEHGDRCDKLYQECVY